MSLFSVFDPVSIGGLSLNWMSMLLWVMVVPVGVYKLSGRMNELLSVVMKMVGGMFKEISYPNFLGLIYLGGGLFFFISINNSLGLFSFVFTGTSHLMITMSMGLVLWMMSFLMGWFMKFKDMSAHLVPEGAPLMLAPFMIVIESVSQLIRPITLSVRLAANMMAGHLIIGLISSISLVSGWSFVFSVIMQSIMLVLEWAVVFIQAFVFSVLVMLYSLEVY